MSKPQNSKQLNDALDAILKSREKALALIGGAKKKAGSKKTAKKGSKKGSKRGSKKGSKKDAKVGGGKRKRRNTKYGKPQPVKYSPDDEPLDVKSDDSDSDSDSSYEDYEIDEYETVQNPDWKPGDAWGDSLKDVPTGRKRIIKKKK